MTGRPIALFVADLAEPELFDDAEAVGRRLHELRAGRRIEFTQVRQVAWGAADPRSPIRDFGAGVRIAAGPKQGDLEHLAVVAGPGVDTIDRLTAVLRSTFQKKAA